MQQHTWPPLSKIVFRKELKHFIHRLKQQGKTIVSTNGSFDLLHIGHVTMLQEAKLLGDVLIIGLNSDASIKRYKGKYRPICPEAHRAGMLAALECVDYITIFDELTPLDLLSVIRPHIHVNSPEHGKDCVEREVVEQHGGRIHLARLVEGMSTTQLLNRIQDSLAHTPSAALFINAKSVVLAWEETELSGQRQEDIRAFFTQLMGQGFQIVLFQSAQETHASEEIKSFIPHHSNITFCLSEKPSAKLFEQLADERDLILAKSVVISHDMQDIQAGREVNSKTILLTHRQTKPDDIAKARNAAHAIVQAFQDLPEVLHQF